MSVASAAAARACGKRSKRDTSRGRSGWLERALQRAVEPARIDDRRDLGRQRAKSHHSLSGGGAHLPSGVIRPRPCKTETRREGRGGRSGGSARSGVHARTWMSSSLLALRTAKAAVESISFASAQRRRDAALAGTRSAASHAGTSRVRSASAPASVMAGHESPSIGGRPAPTPAGQLCAMICRERPARANAVASAEASAQSITSDGASSGALSQQPSAESRHSAAAACSGAGTPLVGEPRACTAHSATVHAADWRALVEAELSAAAKPSTHPLPLSVA
eukprot:scaffold94822_cov25-Tisochrysis_lutea.AAC.3